MIDPLSPISGATGRLALAATLIVCVWLAVVWAL
jgi:hypothetical protein